MDEYYKALDEAKSSSGSSTTSSSSTSSSSTSSSSTSSSPTYKTLLQTLLEDPSKADVFAPLQDIIKARMTVGNEDEEDKGKKEEKKVDFFQKGAFEDGWQAGDLVKTILGTTGDAALGVVKGVGSLAEGLVDLVDYGIAGVADLAGADDYADRLRQFTSESLVDKVTLKASDYLDQYSVLGRSSDAIMQGLGQVGGIVATGGLGSAAGLSSAGVTALTSGVMGLSGMGSGMGEAYQGGATDGEALAYGAISGAADALTELMFGGLGKAVNAVGFSKGLSSADDMLAKAISSKFKNQIAKNFAEYGVKASAEGLEEVVAGVAQAMGKKLTYMSEKDLKDILKDENLLEQFVVGSVTSGMIQSGFIPGTSEGSLIEANKNGYDFIDGAVNVESDFDAPIVENQNEAVDTNDANKKVGKPENVPGADEVNPVVEESTPVVEQTEVKTPIVEPVAESATEVTADEVSAIEPAVSETENIASSKANVEKSTARKAVEGKKIYQTELANKGIRNEYTTMMQTVEKTGIATSKATLDSNFHIQKKSDGSYYAIIEGEGSGFTGIVLNEKCSSFDEAYTKVWEYLYENHPDEFSKQISGYTEDYERANNTKTEYAAPDNSNAPILDATVSETENVAPTFEEDIEFKNQYAAMEAEQEQAAFESKLDSEVPADAPVSEKSNSWLDWMVAERDSLRNTLMERQKNGLYDAETERLANEFNKINSKIENMKAQQAAVNSEVATAPIDSNTTPVVEQPVTTADKAREHYRSNILNRGDVLSKLVNSGKTTFKAVDDATKQAQTLISKGAEGVKSIGEIFGRISTDGKLGDFEDYLHHLLNVDRSTLNDRFGIHDRPVWGYSAEESQKRADKLAEENPEFAKAAEDVYAFNDYIMRVRVQSGKITQEQADIWKQYYPHYVPISRGGNADAYTTLLKFAESDATDIETLDDFAKEADKAADVYKVKTMSDSFDPLIDTMVNNAFTAHWGLAISDNGVTAPIQSTAQHTLEAPVADTTVETQTEENYVLSSEKAPSPDAVQAADYESLKLMEQADGVKGKVLDAVHWAEDNILDNGRVFEKIDHKKGNRNLYSHWHAIRNAFSSAQYFIGKGNKANGVRALNDIYSEIKKNGLTSEFDSYLAHQRNIDGMTMQSRYGVAANRDFVKDVSAAQSYKEVLKLESEHPQFKQWAKDIYANTGYVIDQMVEHKMLSQDMADLFKELYPHYAPMRYGKNGALESSLESMGQFITEAFNSFAMNDFGLELKHTLRSEINREDMNIDTFIDRLDSGASLFDFDVNGMDEDYHTFTVYEDGELKTFDITREMYMAMNQTRNWMDWKIPVLYQVNEGFRKATTELNWIFAATNGVKDPQEIMWNSQHPLQTYAKFLPAEAAVWSKDSKYRNYYEEYLANGGESVEYFNPNKNTFDADKGVLAYLNQKIGTGAISNLNGRIETAPRLAEYIASREAGKSVQESMLDAAQVTVNFQAGGKLTKFLNRNGCTFLNASVQGALQHVRNIQEGKQNAWKGVSALIAKGVVAGLGSELVKQINHLLWDDDDEYENLPDYIKQDYYLFGKFGDGTWLRLPKGRTNATVEEAIRQVALSSTGDDEADWDSFWKLFIENMAPNNPVTNNLLAPILEVKSNTTWYGEDLVPSRLMVTKDEDGNEIEIPVTKQFDEKTDALSVWLGEQLDYSPKKINYLLNSYTGVVGDTFLPMMTPKAESPDDGLLGKFIAPLKDKFTTDAVLNHRVTGDFYETLEAAELKAEAEDATLQDKLESSILIGYNVEISKLMQEQREIQTSDLPDSEKYKLNRELKEKINALQEKGLEALEDYGIDGIYAEAGDKRYNYGYDTENEKERWFEIKPKTKDGDDNWFYNQEQMFHDNLGVDYADYWNKRYDPENLDVKTLYDERNGKRYNFGYDKNSDEYRWFEIKPKNDDGTDNYYYQQEQRITKDLGISYERYWNNREMFDDFYYIAGGYEKDSPEDDTIETARAVFGYERFAEYAKDLKEIKADKDPITGEPISGTKYRKVQAYVWSLDIPEIEKKILYTMQYPNYKRYKGEIVKYLDKNDDISYQSFYKILDELDYKVDKYGRVTWY